ncbi:MAG: helix-turn-helix transcriptional regulator [Victivallales bacterium]|nr:helix-turn-helix transcriptional regulator [Victivallales bacterium]
MKNQCVRASGGSLVGSAELKTIWEVEAVSGYDCVKGWKSPGSLIAIRTLSGTGNMVLEGMGKIEADGSSLVFVEENKLKRYFCFGEVWNFWWFEFNMYGSLPFPLHKVMRLPQLQEEDSADLAECQSFLVSASSVKRILASSVFCTMFYRWLSLWDGEIRKTPYQNEIDAVIAEMHKRLDGFSLSEMARIAGLGERRFRQIFIQRTGCSPKKYHDRLRLQTGDIWLRQGVCNVGEAAESLGFSSLFHFSRAFKMYHGYAPSRAAAEGPNRNDNR